MPLTNAQELLVLENTEYVRFQAAYLYRVMQLRNPSVKDDLIGYGTIGLVKAARDFDPTVGVKFRTYAQYLILGHMRDNLPRIQGSPTVSYCGTANGLDGFHPRSGLSADDLIHKMDSLTQNRRLYRAIHSLDERERQVVLRVYWEDKPVSSLAKEWGVHPSRPWKVHKQTIALLRKRLRTI